MELKEVASISGKSGLFRILKPTYNGVVVETMDGQKKKMAVSASSKVSILKEISIYTTEQAGSVALQEVLCRIFEKYALTLPITSKADTADLMKFISEIVPAYDETKVYASDIKKLVTWYGIIAASAPELLTREVEKTEEEEVATEVVAVKAEEVKEVEAVKAETKETKAKAEPKTKEPKEVKAKTEPKEAKAKAEPKEVKTKAEPKEVKAKAEPKEAKAKVEPKEAKAKAEPKEVKAKAEPKEKKTTEKKAK